VKTVGGVLSRGCIVCQGSGVLSRAPPRTKARPKKEFSDWLVSPGPEPLGATTECAALGQCEELCSLTGRWKLIQRTDSHRYSTDDVVTAWVAGRVIRSVAAARGGKQKADAPPLSCADIGCGLGSVLLMNAWQFPNAVCCVGAEAQESRHALAKRNIAYNLGVAATTARSGAPGSSLDQGERGSGGGGGGAAAISSTAKPLVDAIHGDLRDPSVLSKLRVLNAGGGGGFSLVTGTPPYFDVAAGGRPPHEESARCLFEYRGGVEAYCKSAVALLAPQGYFCVCQTSLQLKRTYAAAHTTGLSVKGRVDVIPVAGKPPLFFVLICSLATEGGEEAVLGRDTFSPLSSPSSLPYPDMRDNEGPFWKWCCGAAGATMSTPPQLTANRTVEEAAPTPPPSHKDKNTTTGRKQQQMARGEHVDMCGKAFGDELVHVITVRDRGGERTRDYRLLLAELGKPS